MKPLLLEIQAFGSYPGTEVIDFTMLAPRGLFVVAGDTGTGKSTIFDAMCYALFGKMPSKSAGEIRSHHASADTITFARFRFEVDGVTYQAERSPEYERPRRIGTGTTKEAAKAALVRLHADGSSTPIASQTNKMNTEIDGLIGLSSDQFEKVVLLPQGEFTAFLVAGSNDREALLTKLFGGQIYEAIVDALKDRSDKLGREVAEITRKAATSLAQAVEQTQCVYATLGLDASILVEGITADEMRHAAVAAAAPLAEFGTAAKAAASKADTALKTAQAAIDAATRFRDAAVHRERLASLAAAQSGVDAGEASATASRSARPLVAAADAAAGALAAQQTALEMRDAQVAALVELLAGIGVQVDMQSAVAASEGVTKQRAIVASQRAVLSAAENAAAAHAAATSSFTDLAAQSQTALAAQASASQRIAEIVEALASLSVLEVGALETALADVDTALARREALDEAVAQLDAAMRAEVSARTAHDDLVRQFVATQAPRLAAELVEGQPCSVCGSTEHPQPAAHPDGVAVNFDQVDKAVKVLRTKSDAREKATGEVERVRAELGESADRSLDELQERRADVRTQLEVARVAQYEREQLTAERSQVEESERSLGLHVAAIGGQLTGLRATLAEAEAALEAAHSSAAAIDSEYVAAAERVLDQAVDRCADLHDVFSTVGNCSARAAERADALAAALAASEHDDVESARRVLIPEASEVAAFEAAAQHRTALDTAGGALAALEQLGIPETLPDTEQVEAVAKAAVAERDRLAAANTTAVNAHRAAIASLDAHDATVGDAAALIDQRNDALKAHTVCSRGGSLSMPLRRWVLARELDRVTAAANVHLARMTSSRYSLRRIVEIQNHARAFGLDLEVLDAHTGRPRSTSSLSGGEKFQASLALALGLADVVSQGGAGSGRRFEALFIDEGFGSLDENSLNEAIETLHHLQSTGRMVGAITHVEAMKQRLHQGIVVKRLPNGGGSTLTVNP